MYHICHLEVGELARDMLEEQVKHDWPGLVKMLRVEDARKTNKSKADYAKDVKTACRWHDKASMKREMEDKKEKKMRTMYQENL